MIKASSDSEEGNNDEKSRAQMEAAITTTTHSSGSGIAPTASGHLDPRQRRIYLIVFGLDVLAALIGLSLLLVWMYKYRGVTGLGVSDADQLGNLHTVMMYTFMISLNMYTILIYRTHFMLSKDRLKWMHAILSGLNMIMSLLGVFAMLQSHWMKGIPNFYSLHSWIGSTTNAFYFAQFVTGFVSFLRPGLSQHRRSQIMPWHRYFGAMILVLASLAAITGMSELVIFQDKQGVYSSFAPITFIANFAGISVIVMTSLTIYLITAPHYRRPKQADEAR